MSSTVKNLSIVVICDDKSFDSGSTVIERLTVVDNPKVPKWCRKCPDFVDDLSE